MVKAIARVIYLIDALVVSPRFELDTIHHSIKRFILFYVDDGSVGICANIREGLRVNIL